jgi:hypothetical protein
MPAVTDADLDPVMVDELAKAIRDCCTSWECWEDSTEMSKEFYRKYARRALTFIANLPLPQVIASPVEETSA